MSNYPNNYDDDSTLPPVNDNIDQIGGDAINGLRDSVLQIEMTLGLNIAGTMPTLADRIGVFINSDGSPNTSIIYSLGLVTLPVTNSQIAEAAGIPESKLTLDYRTQDLFNYIRDLSKDVNLALGWISVSGVKLEPHLIGAIYRHDLAAIDVAEASTQFLNNVFRSSRDNTDAYTLINDMNNELLAHQWADGYSISAVPNIITNNGATYPSSYAHVASGIFVNTSRFAVIPQTADDVQAIADFIDGSSVLTLGTRIQNLYNNGISRNSRSVSLLTDGYGPSIIPATLAIAYLRGTGNNSIPIDDIAIGDDIIQLMPSSADENNNSFDEKFALVKVGDIIRVNYSADGYNVEIGFVISEKKYIQGGGNKTYIVRIAGKNIVYSPNAVVRIDKNLFNNNKYGVLAVAGVNSPTNITPSLIIGSPRGAQCLGVGFSPDQFNETHYSLYLTMYDTGNPIDGYFFLPAIDVTGNRGATPGSYTLDGIVASTNAAFRQAGFNYRFIAFQHDGEFGIMLADSYNNASFSIVSAVVDSNGFYSQTTTQINFPNNVIDVFPVSGSTAPDPLGFGPAGAGIASPPFQPTYNSTAAANLPTTLFYPLRRNNYYVNGNERESLTLDVNQSLDTYGDGYWVASIDGYSNNAGPPGHTTVTYQIPLDLSASQLKAGKTIVVQPFGTNYGTTNYGRFIIQSVNFTCCPPVETQITVYDAVYGTGVSPSVIAPVGSKVAIYFNSDSVSFNNETATDFSPIIAPFKRHFEIYIDGNGNTYTHERGRISIGGNISVNGVTLYNSASVLGQMNIVRISPKLRGYQFSTVNKITFNITSLNATTGIYSGNLASYDGTSFTRPGPTVSGKIGETTRFYDETNIDYVDIIFNFSSALTSFTNQYIDLQLFPTLALDEEIMIIASCQERTDTGTVDQIQDLRQFGNTSEEELTTSALNYIALPEKILHFNGVARGFDISSTGTYNNSGLMSLTGGLALVNGNFLSLNDQIFTIPPLQELYSGLTYPINYALCVNSSGELVTIGLTDLDSELGTPNAPNRIMTVSNTISSNTYQIDSNTFSYILNDRKDLAPLYIVSAVITGTGISSITNLTVRDVRRFANDSDSNIPAVVTNDKSQGNFTSLAAAVNWIKFNQNYQNVLQIKGASTASTDPNINFTTNSVNIIGAGNTAEITFSSAVTMSNVKFSNMTLVFSSTLTATNVSFDNCTVNLGNVLYGSSNVSISNSTVNLTGTFDNIPNLTIEGCTVNVSTTSCIGFIPTNNTIFENTTFNYTSNPIGVGSYSTTDLVNASAGMIWNNFPTNGVGKNTNLFNMSVAGCTFNNSISDHFPFISLQLPPDHDTFIQNVRISNNNFTSLSSINDLRAVISIVYTGVNINLSAIPITGVGQLINVSIDSNICNYDQMILLSVARTAGVPLSVSNTLSAVNCRISNNTCGTIGFMTGGIRLSSLGNNDVSNGGFNRDKPDQLIIEKNSCKFISNIDSIGDYIGFYVNAFPTPSANTSWIQIGTGPYSIINNSASWIQVGCSSFTNSGVILADGALISGNRLVPNNPSYLSNYTDTLNSSITPYNAAILLRAATGLDGYVQSVISNNIITSKTVSNTQTTYDAGIVCFNNAQIINNSMGGGNNVSGGAFVNAPMIVLGNTGTMSVRGNILNREGATIQAYILGTLSTATNSVSIVDNMFDSPFIDSSNTLETVGVNIPSFWTFRNNVNQTGYAAISLTDHKVYSKASTAFVNTSTPTYPSEYILLDTTNNFSITRLNTNPSVTPFISDGQYLIVSDFDASLGPNIRDFAATIPISTILPSGTKIIQAEIGIWLQESGVATLDTASNSGYCNAASLSLISYNTTNTSNNTTHGIADIKSNLSIGAGVDDLSKNTQLYASMIVGSSSPGTISEAALIANTQYLTITSSAISPSQTAFITRESHRISATIDLTYKRLGTGTGTIKWYLSPVVVKYRW